MKLGIFHTDFVAVISGICSQESEQIIDVVYYDTRLISSPENATFFALEGRRNGHEFLQTAYDKGIRHFVVSQSVNLPEDAVVIQVDDTLRALQQLAKHHREHFSYPVLAITGSLGKTTIKEWLYFLLNKSYSIIRSPKSFNSQLGVAISLLEMTDEHDLAIIEADISHPNEMEFIEAMVSPTLGIYTGIGHHYADNFESQKQHASEHLKLFKYTNITFTVEALKSDLRRNKINFDCAQFEDWEPIDFTQFSYPNNRLLALHVAEFLGIEKDILLKKVYQLPALSNRMEVFEGAGNNLIINDSYNIDVDALEQALSYQFASQEREDKIVVLDLSFVDENRKSIILEIVERYKPARLFLVENDELPSELKDIKNSSILFKGSYRSNLRNLVLSFKNRKHETWVEFDLKAIEQNIKTFQNKLPANVKTMVMVKASAYGAGDVKIPHFLQQIGVDYLGVAYADEGAKMRENDVTLPIMVMNTEVGSFDDLVKYRLEPTIFSFEQLKHLRSYLSQNNIQDFPIHIAVETGMNRLGFYPEDIPELLENLKSTTEIRVKSVYSHLADADNPDDLFSRKQIDRFKKIKFDFEQVFPSGILYHILNSEGASKFGKTSSFDMVRLGIGVFGFTSNAEEDELISTIKWKTTISQIINLQPGDTVSYSRTFTVEKPMKIASIRVGYADGFRRKLSNGVGSVFIQGVNCPVIGRVCMDMTMVDVTNVPCQAGDEVEIIGENIDINEFAKRLETIPYEVMTSISNRVTRVYLR